MLARAACDDEGAHFAIHDGGYEALSIATLATNAGFNNSWVGISDLDAENQFVNVLGEPQEFLPWNGASNEPNGAASENCVRMNVAGAFVDVACSNMHEYICACEP